MEKYKDFIGLFPVQKTLRMGLLPVGRTLENIQKNEVLHNDSVLAENFSAVKRLLDKYHKQVIDEVLSGLQLDEALLAEYAALLEKGDDRSAAGKIQKLQDTLCTHVAKAFTTWPDFNKLWKKEMFSELMPRFLQDSGEKEAVAGFANHVGYFTDYNAVRKNIYDAKARGGAVPCRVVCDNFPLFVYNARIVREIMQNPAYDELKGCLDAIYTDLESYLNVASLAEMFHIDYYTRILTQTQLEVYNMVLGGRTVSQYKDVKGLNEYINMFNVLHPKKLHLPLLKRMKKMILSDRVPLSWVPEKFSSDNELLTAVAEARDAFVDAVNRQDGLRDLVGGLTDCDLSAIIVNTKNINRLSHAVYGQWFVIKEVLVLSEKTKIRRTSRMTDDDVYDKAVAAFKKHRSFSIRQIMDALEGYGADGQGRTFSDWLANQRQNPVFVTFKAAARKADELLDFVWPDGKSLIKDTGAVAVIKELVDTMTAIKDYAKLFVYDGTDRQMDSAFYEKLFPLYENLSAIVPLYNMVRNYLTRKPYDEKKMKLNFNYINFLNGWDADKVREYGSMLLSKDGDLYLAILQKGIKLDVSTFETNASNDGYERIVYKQMVGAFKMLPKIFFSDKWIKEGRCVPGNDILQGYAERRHLKGNNFDLAFCHKLIDYFKQCCMLNTAWDCYRLKFSATASCKDISQFYQELEKQTYSISFRMLDKDMIDRCVEDGSIYLFKIYNRDLSAFSKGKKQMQTLYYQMLLDKRNLDDLVIKLNGGAEIFFRKASLSPDRPTHPAGIPMTNKNPLNIKKENTFTYPLTKDYRYTKDTFHFHFPVTINCNSGSFANVNQVANNYIRKTDDLHVIGINRGERNLIYVTVINPQGLIVEQFSLNVIESENNNGRYRTDYHELLTRRENERAQARESWMTVKNIVNLKEGYLSAALHKVVSLLDKYNAVIAIEDLDDNFKNNRRHIEHEIYSKFEEMLVNKLNYLTFKTKDVLQPGGVLRGLQLAARSADMGSYTRQNGIIFKVPTWYVGMTCPVTGFVNFLKPRYTNIKEARMFFEKMDEIVFNGGSGWFEFTVDYGRFMTKEVAGRKQWTVCTAGTRHYKGEEVNLTKELFDLFSRFRINVYADIKEQILKQDSKEFFVTLIQLFSLTLQMRNVGEGIDYLVSPVKDDKGYVFVSNRHNNGLPVCIDANDAYNIARKGLIFVNQIKKSKDEWVKLSVSNAEWMEFVQQ